MPNSGPQLLFSQQLCAEKYWQEGEGHREKCNRVASALKDSPEHFHAYRDITLDMRFLEGGRIQAGMGTSKIVTQNNCYVSGTIEDSLIDGPGSIMDRAKEAAQTLKLGGGIGYDFSTLRPRGELIRKLQSHSTGPMSFMEIFNSICLCIASAGHRRGAQMGVLRIDHPDVEEFVHAKQNDTRFLGFNLSLAVTDEFMECLASGKPFPLQWGGQIYREIDPQELWEMVMRSTWDWAEPGVLFVDTINRMNNLWYCETIAATNPCVTGETPILTDKGHLPIQSLVGKEVHVWNGEAFCSVTPYSTGINPIFRVQLSNGRSLECTPAHRFLIQGKNGEELICAKDLEEGMRLSKTDMPVVSDGEDFSKFGDAYSQGFYSGDGVERSEKSRIYQARYDCMKRLRGTISEEHPDRQFRLWSHGPMLDKDFVPINGALPYCLQWLSGLLDANSSASPKLPSIQLTSANERFLLDVQLMLTRMGVRGHLARVDRTNGEFWNDRPWWRLTINQTDVQHLLKLGLDVSRLELKTGVPHRDARRYVTVVSVEDLQSAEETFCFTEETRGLGTFNGIVTGQCGEQPLPPHGTCLLGSFNLVRYVRRTSDIYYFDWDQFREDIPHVVRAMDNVVDRARYPLPEQRTEALSKRRMGLGVTGLANVGEVLGFPYGSHEFLDFETVVLNGLNEYAYLASVELAKEKDAFLKFDPDKYCQSEFIKSLPDYVQDQIRKYGIRNSHLTSIAPTGTISFAADYVSSGIEPVFEFEGRRKVHMKAGLIEVDISDYGFREWGGSGKLAKNVTIQEHVDVVAIAAKRVDSAVSKTCNHDGSLPWDEFKGLYVQAWERGCKGLTTFNKDGKRGGILLEKPKEEKKTACYVDPETGVKECS